MTDLDRIDASIALCDWFKSQKIRGGDAALIMVRLIAAMLGASASSKAELYESINSAHESLSEAARLIFEDTNQ